MLFALKPGARPAEDAGIASSLAFRARRSMSAVPAPSRADATVGSAATASHAHDHSDDRSPTLVADRGEFIDALHLLNQGHVLVRAGEGSGDCVLDGATVYRSFAVLQRYGLIAEFHNPLGFAQVRYYRITRAGQHFADRALAAWRRRPLWQRLAVRLLG